MILIKPKYSFQNKYNENDFICCHLRLKDIGRPGKFVFQLEEENKFQPYSLLPRKNCASIHIEFWRYSIEFTAEIHIRTGLTSTSMYCI